jgi:hypothetical protein
MHYLVEVIGDTSKAMGLLALRGIQNMFDPSPAGRGRITARLSADTQSGAILAVCGYKPLIPCPQ